jgi:tRNA/tmRNA/rRNA uracil-C5-methylase (TrmA/RlmC/RlmD family)
LEEAVRQMEAIVEAIDQNEALCQTTNFGERVLALDRLQDDVIEPIEVLLAAGSRVDELMVLKQRANATSERLETINEELVRKLRSSIRSGSLAGRDLQEKLVVLAGRSSDKTHQNVAMYDGLDSLVSRLLLPQAPPKKKRQLEPEMVFYQPTPARLIFRMIETVDFQKHDVFFDLGSGLGQVVMLVHLLGNVRSRGIEFEPAYCEYAQQTARGLYLSGVEFIAADVREADLSAGTFFFMYTPFEGEMLDQVLERLRVEAQSRTIRIHTYGLCTLQVSKQAWLEPTDGNSEHVYRLSGFKSVET